MIDTKKQLIVLRELRKASDAIYEQTGLAVSLTAEQFPTTKQERKIYAERISAKVSRITGVSLEKIRSEYRDNEYSLVRHVICHICSLTINNVTLGEIGHAINKDRGTVKNSLERAEMLIDANDAPIMKMFDNLLKSGEQWLAE